MINKVISVVAAFLTIAALASEHPYGGITFVGTFDIEGIGLVTDHTIWPETYPTQFHARAVLPEGKHLFGYKTSHNKYTRYPLMDESLWFMPPMKSGDLMTVEAIVATAQYYVDPNPGKGSDEENNGSKNAPFATLQRAVNEGSTNAKEYTVIYAAPGNYTLGGATPNSSTKARVVIDRNVRIKGAGRNVSFIHGKKDTTSGQADEYGCGPEAERCIQFTSFSETCVQGFTICNGYSGLSSPTPTDAQKGGIIAKGIQNHIVDSIISNCYGYTCTAAYCGSFVRTLITACDKISKNTLTGNNNQGLRLIASIARTRSNSGGVKTTDQATLIQSTVTGDNFSDINGAYGFGNTALATNCVLGAGNRSYTTNTGIHGNLIWASSGVVADAFKDSNILYGPRNSGDWTIPLLMDVHNDDVTPLSISPVIGAGMMYEDYFVTYSPDYNGNPILFVDGKPTLGAIQTTVQALVLPKSAQFATLNIEGATQLTNGVHEGDTVTLTLKNPTRPGGSFIVNGNKIPGPSFTFTAGEWNSKEIGNAFEISEVVFDNSWYVDAKYGDDNNTGFYPGRGHAKKTLVSVCTNSAFLKGDTLHAAPGIYDEGNGKTGNGFTRCPVDEDRHVVADAGPFETFIVGAPSTDETRDFDGCGPGAVRCLSIGKNSTLSGFTITGGRTDLATAADGLKSGAGGYNNTASILFNCIISNNIASGKGSAVRNGKLVNCRIFENANSSNSGILQGTELYGCIIDRNRSNSLTPESNKIYNSVIGSNNVNYANTASAWCIYYPMQNNIVANTICLGRFGSTAGREIIATNSVFVSYGDAAANFIALGGSSFITNKGAALLDSNYAPLPEFRKFTVDGGDNSFIFDIYGGNDILGSQRIYNGTIDIGPMEEDFRPVYKTIFAPTAGFTLEYASPLVYASGKTLHVGNGQSIKIKWERSSLRKIKTEVLANVTGNGALKIFSNGKLVATVTKASVNKTVFTINSQISDLVFSFEGDGYASLQNLSSAEQGLVLSFL